MREGVNSNNEREGVHSDNVSERVYIEIMCGRECHLLNEVVIEEVIEVQEKACEWLRREIVC